MLYSNKWLIAGLLAFGGSVAQTASTFAQTENPKELPKSERKYEKDFSDQDLSNKSFKSQRLDNCNFENANLQSVDFSNASLIDCNFQGANLNGARFDNADASGCDFRDSFLTGVSYYKTTLNRAVFDELDLTIVSLTNLKMRGASFRNSILYQLNGCDLFEADFRGANLSTFVESSPSLLRKAKCDQFTKWPNGFDLKKRGLVILETKSKDRNPSSPLDGVDLNAVFQKLDSNLDGVLSGNEAKGYLDKDEDGDGEISLNEFLSSKPK